MRRFLVIACLVAIGLLTRLAGAEPLVLKEDADGSTIRIPPGQEFQVKLAPGLQGAASVTVAPLQADCVEALGREGGEAGQPYVFNYRAAKVGTTPLVITFAEANAAAPTKAWRYGLTIKVRTDAPAGGQITPGPKPPEAAPPAKPSEAPAKAPEAVPPAKPPEAPAKAPEAASKAPEAAPPAKPPEAPVKPPEAPAKPPEAPAKPPEAVPVVKVPEAPPMKPADLMASKEPTIRFQFDGIPYPEVVRRFCQMSGKPLLGDITIPGSLTFFDSEPYTYPEALDTLNMLLGMRAFMMVENGRFLQVVPLTDIMRQSLRILHGVETTEELRPGEVVTVVLPLKYLDANVAVTAIQKMVSTFGSLSPLAKGKGIVITDRVKTIQRVRALLDELDVEKMVERQMRSYVLKYASAQSVAAVINNLFGRGATQGPRLIRNPSTGELVPAQGPEAAITATADERSRTVFLMGAGDMLAQAEAIIEKLDVEVATATAGEPGAPGGEVRIFELKNARAEDVATTVRQVVVQGQSPSYDRYGQRVPSASGASRIVADAATNRLVVAAPLDQLPVIEKLIKDLDKATIDVGGTRIFHLKTADAQQLAQVISATFARRDARTRTGTGGGLSVTADPRINALIVAGPAGDIQIAATLIEELDKERPEESRDFHVVQLKTGDARQMATALVRLFTEQTQGWGRPAAASKLRVEAEPLTNSLLISAAPGDWTIIQKILTDLNKAPTVQGPDGTVSVAVGTATTRLIPLKNARATELAETLRQIYSGRRGASYSDHGSGGAPSIPVVIAASERTNSLLVSAGAEDQQAIATLVQAMDVPVSERASAVRIVRLKSADATKLAATLRAMLPPAASSKSQPVLIEADATTNSVLLRAPEADQKTLEDMISSLDEGTKQMAREMRLIELKHVSAANMAMMLRQLYPMTYTGYAPSSSRYSQGAAQPESVVIAAAPGDRALVVEAPRQTIEAIAQLVKTLDTADSPAQTQVRTYALTNAHAADLARSLSQLFAQQYRGPAFGQAGAEPAPRFEADPATNHLLVSATPGQFEVIEGLVKKLEAVAVLAGQTKTFKLKFAKAPDVVTVLQSMLGEGAALSGAYGRSESKGLVRVAAMADSNTVIVQAPPDKMAMAEQLITTFDSKEASPPSVIEIVQLKNAQAATLAQAVTTALAEQKTVSYGERGHGADKPEQVTVTPEPNSNSVLVRGPTDKVKDAVAMIQRLDEGGTTAGIQIRVYPLKNGTASELASTLGRLFQGMVSQQGRSSRASETPTCTVAADERTNSLVVSATPAHFALVEDLLKTLDKTEEVPEHNVQYITLKNANASDVVDKLKAMYADRKGAEKPVIEADFFTNAVTIIAKDADVKAMEPIITKLDEAAKDNSLQVRVIPVSRMKAERMAEVLQRVFGQMSNAEIIVTDKLPGAEGGSEGPKPLVLPPVRQGETPKPAAPRNAEILEAPKDTPSPPPEPPAPAAPKAGPKPGAKDAAPAGAPERPRVTIAVDKNSNSLIVSGTRQELANLQALIDQLLPSGATEEAEIRVYKISKGDPTTIARTLNDLFNPRAAQPQVRLPQQPSAQESSGRPGRGQPQAAPSAPPPSVVVVPDVHTKSLLVRAKPMDFEMLEPLIKHLDQMSTVVNELRVFSLKNTDANEVAANLQELFRMQSERRQPSQPQGYPPQMGVAPYAQQQRAEQIRQMFEMPGGQGTAQVDASTLVKISANRVTNSVVVAAPADAMELIAQLIRELDQSAAPVTIPVVRMYPLKTAEVATTVRALQDLFPSPQRGGAGPRGRGMTAAFGAPLTPDVFGAPVIVTGDEAGRLVIVSAPEEKQELIAKVIKEIDQAQGSDAMTVKIYKVQYADVASVAAALTNALTSGAGTAGGRPGQGPRGASGLRISADASTGSLVVRASAEEHGKIAKLLTEMDVAPALQYAVQTIPLKNADATMVASSLNRLFASTSPSAAPQGPGSRGLASVRQGSVVIEGDRNAKMLLVRADKETFAKIQELVAKMDTATASTELAPTVIALKHAEAMNVASAISQVFSPYRYGRGIVNPEEVVTVVGEPLSNSLLVTASATNLAKVQALIDKLDTETAGGMRTELVILKNAKAADLAAVLSRIAAAGAPGGGGQRGARGPTGIWGMTGPTPLNAPVVAGDPASNALVISGPGTDVDRLKQMALQLDEAAGKFEAAVVKLYPLKTAEVQPTVAALTQIFSQPSALRGAARGAPGAPGAAEQPIAIAGDEAGRLVIVSAPAEKHELIAKVIKEIDQAQGADQVALKVYKIQYADAASVAAALSNTFMAPASGATGGRGGAAGRGAGGLRISADPSSNSLLVRASAEDHEKVAKMLTEMDIAPAMQYAVQTIPLKNADATVVAASLNRLFAADPARGARGLSAVRQGQVIVEGDHNAKMLMVRADAETFKKVQEIATKLDTATAPGELSPTVIALKHADAPSVAAALSQVFSPQARGPRGQVAPEDVVTVVGEPLSNSLIVTASATNLAKVQTLLKELDTETAGAIRTELLVLKNAKAVDLAAVLSRVTASAASAAAAGGRGPRGTAGPSGAAAAVVTGDPASNTLLLCGPGQEVDRLKKMALELDESAGKFEAAVIRIYPLKTAEVQPTVAAVSAIFSDPAAARGGARGPAGTGAAEPPVVVTGDEAGRLVIVSAPAEKHPLIAKLIDEIDQAEGADQVALKVYKLQYADATSLAPALASTLTSPASGAAGRTGPGARGAAGSLRISADASSNSLIVRASAEDHEKLAKMIAEMDVAPAAQYAVQTIPLKSADAALVAQSLSRVFTNPTAGRGAAAQNRQPIVIEGDRDSRTLMVRADPQTFEKIQKLALQLDGGSGAGQIAPNIIPLKFAQATTVAAAINQAFASPRGVVVSPDALVTAVAEPLSNSLIVTAGPANLPKVQELVAQLDNENVTGVRREFMVLAKAKATDLANVLTKVYSSTSRPAGTANQPPVVVAADAGSNALVMTGPAADIDKLKLMAKDLDQATTPTVPGVYIISLKNGDAVTVSAMVRDLYSQQVQAAAKTGRTIEPLAVSSDDRANAVVIATNEEMYKQVQEWVAKVEEMKPARGNLRIVTLQNADPTEVQNAINQLFGNLPAGPTAVRRTPASSPAPRPSGPRGAPGAAGPTTGRANRVESTVLPQQRALLIDASDEDYEAIQKLVEALDAAAGAARRQVQVFTLKNATNTQVATSLNTLYLQVTRAGAPDQEKVSITALPQTRAVVVSANKEKMDEIAHLIEALDKEEIAPQLEFRIYPLTNAMPLKILPALQQMLAQVKIARPNETVNVQADERTRSIIVTARGTVFDQVEKIIQALDKPPAFGETEVLIIKLKKGDATRMAAVLNEMLQPTAAGQVTPEARALQEQVRLIKVRVPGAESLPDLDLTKPIKITADPNQPNLQGANALMISSTPDNLKAMQAVVELLDTVPMTEGVKVRLVHLANADAESVMTILREVFLQGQRLGGKTGTSVAGKAEPDNITGKALVNPFNVSADLRTNTIVMSGLEESLALAELVVKDLDRDAGKLVTEVRLFKLRNADVTRLLPVLQAVFSETTAVAATAVGAEGLRTQVTRLRTRLEKETGHVTELPKTRAALTVQGDPTTNILVVAARSDVMPLIADVIQTMDIPGAGSMNIVRIFPLVNADATRMKTIIDQLYTIPAGAATSVQLRPEDKPTVAVDARTNALVVTSSDKTLTMIETLLVRLDAKTPIDLKDVKLLALKTADATALAPLIQRMMDARVQRQTALGIADAAAVQAVVLADPRSNCLMVGGSAETFDLVKSLAEQLDNAGPGLIGQVQVFELKHANAGSVSTTLGNLFRQRYAAARTPDLARQAPAILPDLRTNSLVVTANPDDTQILQTLLKKLDVEQQNLAVELVVIPMKFNDAGIVGPTINTLFQARLQSMTVAGQPPQPQDRVDVVVDSLTNALIVSASKENLALIRALLEKVDIEPPSESGIVRMYALKNSDAQRIATMLQGLVSQGLYKPGIAAAGANATLAAREKVSIAVDLRTNVLIVSASKENFKVLEQIIDKIDSGEDFNALSDIRMYTLKRADATRLGPTLQQFFNTKRAGEQATGGAVRSIPVVILPDTRTNTLLVAGGRENFAAVEAMIQKLDSEQTLMGADFRVFFLKQAVATSLQPTLQILFTQRIERDTTKEPVTVVADPRTNAIIVGASPEDMALAENLVNRLDAVPLPGSTLQVFPLSKADALQVANTLRNLYQSEGAAAAAAVGISADTRLNAIVVSAGAADMQRIADLVRQLDTATITEVTEIRIIGLRNADATELARIVADSLNNKPKAVTPGGPVAQSLLQFVTRTKDGQELVTSALQEGVLITPDRRSNSIVISAPVQNMPLLEALIQAMDSTQPRLAEIRVITLQNADARQMATILAELFRAQASGQVGAVGGTGANAQTVNYTLSGTESNGEKSVATATVGGAEQYALSITVDGRTNSLLIGGTQQYVELCNKVIQELDSSPAQERQTQIYRLRNAQATDIETALRTFLDQERQRLVAALGTDRVGAAQRLLEHEVAVVSEKTSNMLLVSASPRYFESVSKMVEELDQPPPQVLIQVLLVEITLDDTLDFGMDWNFTGRHDTGRLVGTGPVTPTTGTTGATTTATTTAGANLPTRTTLTQGGTGFGVQADIAKGGFSVSVTGGDFQYFLRALQSQGRLEVLSRPQILASDNQIATINIGQRVPFVTSSRISDTGIGVFNTIQYQPVGIILNVTPRINPDGFVRLQVAPEVSSISSSSVQISENVNASIINSRSATTTVTVQDGHTIIIGGLITTSNDERETKIPILGDIPLLGYLFKTTTKVKQRTELLIILTPEVLRTVPQADLVTARQVKSLTLPKAMQKDALRDTTFDPTRPVKPPGNGTKNGPALQGPAEVPKPGPAEGGQTQAPAAEGTPAAPKPWVTVIPDSPSKEPAK